jgi:hypothetical protein
MGSEPSGMVPDAVSSSEEGEAEGRASGLRRCSLSSLMLWPWLARISQWVGSVEDSSSDGLVAGLGLMAKRFLSELWTASRISGKVGARERSGPHCSWESQYVCTSVVKHLLLLVRVNKQPLGLAHIALSTTNHPPPRSTPLPPSHRTTTRKQPPKRKKKKGTHHLPQTSKPLPIQLDPRIPRLMPQQP